MARTKVSKILDKGNGVDHRAGAAPSLEVVEDISVADSERVAATQMLGELQALQVQHSLLMEQKAAVEREFDRKEQEMLTIIAEKKKEQNTWLRRTAAAHGIDVEAENQKWKLDTTTWKFLRT